MSFLLEGGKFNANVLYLDLIFGCIKRSIWMKLSKTPQMIINNCKKSLTEIADIPYITKGIWFMKIWGMGKLWKKLDCKLFTDSLCSLDL